MRESCRFGAVAAVAMLSMVMAPASIMAGADGPQWTFMVYMDADNNLETYGLMNLEWLETVGSDENVNFVVLMDTYGEEAQLLYVEEGKSTPVEELAGVELGFPAEVNMAAPDTLSDFINVSYKYFEAEKHALILWDHGGGWRGLCWDDTSILPDGTEDCITMVELRDALAWSGKRLDVIGFDLCLMAMPEVAYQVDGYADYVVFSEETVPGYGFPYETIAAGLVADPGMDGKGLCTLIVDEYAIYYTGMGGYWTWTMSAFDMEYMDDVFDAVDELGTELLDSLTDYMQYYQMDLVAAERYYYPYNVDLRAFAENLVADKAIDDDGIKAAAEKAAAAVEDGIFANEYGDHSEVSYGMAIYIPSTNDGMHDIKEDYILVPFATATSWYDFAEAFSSFYGRTWGVVTAERAV